jgi:hypothetical protein
MATNSWRGDYLARAQVVTLVVGSTTSGHTFVTTMNGKSITYTAVTSETTSTIATAIQALLAASEIPEFQEVEWTVDTATVTGTAKVPGVSFTVSKSGTGTYTLTTTVASTGPNHVDEPKNWSAGTLPDATEDVVVDVPVDMLYGFENLPAAAYNSLRIKAAFAANLGLPRFNPAGYVEYRTRFWTIDTAIPLTIGEGDGTGPTRCNIATGTAIAAVVLKTGTRPSDTEPAVNLTGAASGTVSVAAGDVALAGDDDTTAITVTTLTMDNAATVTVGRGATATTVEQKADAVLVGYGTVTTLNTSGGTATLYTPPTTVTADGACVVDLRGTGTTATVTARGQGEGRSPRIECGNNPRAKTFTNHSFTGGAVLSDPDKTVVMTNAGTWDRASLAASDLGARFTLTRT